MEYATFQFVLPPAGWAVSFRHGGGGDRPEYRDRWGPGPAHADRGFFDGLPDLTKRQVESRVKALSWHYRLDYHDREDLTQDFAHAIFRGMKNYDPSQACPTHFARKVSDTWNAYSARGLSREVARRACTRTGAAEDIIRMAAQTMREHRAEQDLVDGRLDLPTILGKLPPDMAEFARLLADHSPAEIAAKLGEDRVTAWRKLQRLRELVRSILEQNS